MTTVKRTTVKRTTIQQIIEDGRAIVGKSDYRKLLKDAEKAGVSFKVMSQYESQDQTFFVLEIDNEGENKSAMNKYSINEIMTIIEASERYGINHDTLKNKFKRTVTKPEKIEAWIKEGLIRQSGRTWLVTEQFIENNFPVKA